ncbi:hypothetical protein AAFC00_004846 [Neodothiora populina]|uniref:SET domain-containing protein n=1 Tax=Neodothiora populina TaxID=2781224 RepID=A0ABR3P3N0_9PEZI
MASLKLERLVKWFIDNGGYLHPSIILSYDEQLGAHFRCSADVAPGTHVLTVPHHLAISNLNAQVDDAFPVFRSHAKQFTVEALTFFYLCAQYINIETSFWRPYLESLPSPASGYDTPLWFADDDRKWLEGTDLQPTSLAREAVWRTYWQDGIKILESEGIDVDPYTWDLFKWAATVYTSRSFNSQTVRPQDSKYWTAYKYTPQGRQTALLDLSNYSQDWKDFSILFPVMDAGNHNPNARVDWAYDPGRFSFTVSDGVKAGEEVFNNYGPKGNDELLMGYGFCAADNPHDGILLSMRPPPPPLQEMLRVIHPGYFKTSGEWNSEAATFRLLRWQLHDTSDFSAFSKAWAPIPEPLAELFCYIVQFERGVEVTPVETPEDYLYRGYGQRYLPRIALYIMMSLLPKIQRLEQSNDALPEEPQNSRQAMAAIYREGQIEVLDDVQERMAAYLKSLVMEPPVDSQAMQPRSAIWTLEGALDIVLQEAPVAHKAFMGGVKYCAGTTKLRKLRGTDQEEFMWTILLCFMYLHYRKCVANGETNDNSILWKWMRNLESEYGAPVIEADAAEEEADEDAAVYLDRVKKAAMFLPGSVWKSSFWTRDFVLDWGMRLTKSQGTYMDVGDEDMRYVMYLHIDGA